MAIAQDAVTNLSNSSSGVTSYSFNHTCTGTNGLLLVCVECDDGDHVTGVTYNGVAMTQLVKFNQTADSTCIYIYGLLAPTTGTNAVLISRSSSTSTITGGSVSFTGVSQSGLPDAFNSNGQTSGSSNTTSITTVANNAWIVGFLQYDNQNITVGTGSTVINTGPNAGGPWSMFKATANPITPAGAQSLTMNGTSSDNAMLLVSFAPIAASGAVAHNLSSLGAGA
jgi:hypothetical protein